MPLAVSATVANTTWRYRENEKDVERGTQGQYSRDGKR